MTTADEFRTAVRHLRLAQRALAGIVRALGQHKTGPRHDKLRREQKHQVAEVRRLEKLIDTDLARDGS